MARKEFEWTSSPILDIRPDPGIICDHCNRNKRLTKSAHVAIDDVLNRTAELPDRTEPWAILAPARCPANCRSTETSSCFTPEKLVDVLLERGWWKDLKFVPSTTPEGALFASNSQRPILYDDEAFWQHARAVGRWDGSATVAQDKFVLFKPCPLLEETLPIIEESLIEMKRGEMAAGEIPPPNQNIRFRCLDMGCGAGRDLAYLAVRSGNSSGTENNQTLGQWHWEIVGMDWISDILERARAIFRNLEIEASRFRFVRSKFRLDGTLRFYEATSDQEQDSGRLFHFGPGQSTTGSLKDDVGTVDLLLCVRFLARSHYEWMRKMVKPGGFVLVYTFFEGVQEFGAPKDPNHILQPGELATIFRDKLPEDGTRWDSDVDGTWEVLVDRIDRIPDGRPIQAFLARKRMKELQ
ncbi:hypothetical protein HDU97_003140 [Phlyctochytrium planicorne]|nr:hypothetical protein HDU97_003140 [Phlyctochytrium planicorne]